MRKFDRAAASTYAVADVEVARWEQFELGGLVPFDAMWSVVPPGATGPVDWHPEHELSIVVGGSALVRAGGSRTVVEQGNAFLVGRDEPHMVTNRSSEHALVLFSACWMAAVAASALPPQRMKTGVPSGTRG
jgi:quercetin dioxygenase-like cupin family protein